MQGQTSLHWYSVEKDEAEIVQQGQKVYVSEKAMQQHALTRQKAACDKHAVVLAGSMTRHLSMSRLSIVR